MSTDEQNVPPAESAEPKPETSDSSREAAAEAPSAPAEQAAAPQPTSDVASAAPAAPDVVTAAPEASEMANAAGPDGDVEPGDDIGNRVPGGAPRSAEGASPEGGAKKKRRRRRKKKDVEGEAGGAEGAAAAEAVGDGGEASAEAGGAEGKKKKRRKPRKAGAPPRERPAFRVGEEVFGRVAKLTEHAVWIDIAGKAMGLFDRRELMDGDPPAEGDQFIAVVVSGGVRGGMLMLGRALANLDEIKPKIEAAVASGEQIDGFVTGAVKGGLEVDLGGLRAFAPASHVDLRPGADLAPLVGQHLGFYIVHYEKKGRDIVVSRKKDLVEEARKARTEALAKLEPGSLHKGIVRTVVSWGVFVALPDADDVEGLVHLSEVSHDRAAKHTELFSPGQEIEVKVLKIDDKGKLWLSRKAAVPDPWDGVAEKYALGTLHTGKIVRLQPFGAFIELEAAVDGLCHTSDLSLKQIAHPEEVVKVGDEIEVVVATLDRSAHRIGLHPALSKDERDEPKQKVAQYKPVKAAVVQAVEGGLVVRILGVTGRMARAFIPAGHTGTQRGTDLRKAFPVGTQVEAKVLDIDPRRGEAKLSIRALKDDSEKQAYQKYRKDVARDSKFGTFADLMKKNQPS